MFYHLINNSKRYNNHMLKVIQRNQDKIKQNLNLKKNEVKNKKSKSI